MLDTEDIKTGDEKENQKIITSLDFRYKTTRITTILSITGICLAELWVSKFNRWL